MSDSVTVSEYRWHDAKVEIPDDSILVIFIATEFGYPAVPLIGYRFGETWHVSSKYYGSEWPDGQAPSDILYWTYIPGVQT